MTAINPAPRPDRPFTGRHMLMLMIAFFGVVIAANTWLAISAATSWTGLVVENSYVASQEFQKKADALHEQQRLGWTASLVYAAGTVRLTLTDATGAPIALDQASIKLTRPMGVREDRSVALVQGPDGGYMAALDLGPGIWDAVAIGNPVAHGPFELHQRFKVEAK